MWPIDSVSAWPDTVDTFWIELDTGETFAIPGKDAACEYLKITSEELRERATPREVPYPPMYWVYFFSVLAFDVAIVALPLWKLISSLD